ncbi:MAG: biopolymer transporter ExbD [Lentisphaeria bacterium]|nr:biopolymer transporter ExbD [Lentisphaeria bacterium]
MKKNETTTSCVHVRTRLQPFRGLPPFIPYLGLFFILILFFMLSSSSMPVQGVKVTLPTAAMRETQYVSRHMIVTADAFGKFYFNDIPAENLQQLKRRVSEAVSKYGTSDELIFRCDQSINADTMMKLTEIASELNMTALFVVDQPKQTGKTSFMETER